MRKWLGWALGCGLGLVACNTIPRDLLPWETETDREADHWTAAVSDGLESGGPSVTFYGGPTSGVAPLRVYLDGTKSKAKADGSWIARCQIDFGDGEVTDICWGEHVYPAGEFTATFTATDNRGRSTSAQLVITVSGPSTTSVDAGGPGPAPTDAGASPVDAGAADAGVVDAGTPPVDAGTAPVDAGVMPTDALRWYGGGEGVAWARSVSADEGGVIWAVNDSAILSLSPGETRFQSHPGVGQLARGDWPYTICGAGPNQAFVGYVAPEGLPMEGGTAEQRLRGDLDRVVLDAPHVLRVEHHYQITNTNNPNYDEVQTVVACVRQNDRASSDYGSIYLGSNHAVTRVRGDSYADHRHVVFSKANGSLVIGYNWAVALKPDGDLFFANDFKFGILKPTTVLNDWLSFSVNPWVLDTYAPVLGAIEDADKWHAAAVTPDGRHWLGSWGKGLLWMTPTPRRYTVISDAPDIQVNALAAEADNSVWVATHNAGLWRYDGSAWRKLPTPSQRILGLFLDTRTQPRTLYIASDRGVGVYQGP